MEFYLLDWANLLLRWAHVVVAIAWIGSSFYFVFLDSSLTKPTAPDLLAKGVDGELWAVHGGGFYNPQKYMVAPRALPEHLHWFYWESYSTWLTGFALFTAMYLFNPGTFLIDRNVYDWSAGAAIATSIGLLAAFWFAYDAICRVLGPRRNGDALVGLSVLAIVVAASWLACQLYAGRAAFLLVGAMMATAMSANVLVWIIPGQRKVIAQMKAGAPVDPVHGRRGKERSVHNTYFTLPVLVAMLSNHYPWLYQGPNNWIVLVALMLAGALVRHSFVARHRALVEGRRVPWEHAIGGTALLVALAVWLAPAAPVAPVGSGAGASGTPAFAEVAAIMEQRCAACHNPQLASKNVLLHTPAAIAAQAQAIYQQAVVLRTMPIGNSTGMTDAERALLRRWYEGGAPAR
jgi:uncharacterized membrane protein